MSKGLHIICILLLSLHAIESLPLQLLQPSTWVSSFLQTFKQLLPTSPAITEKDEVLADDMVLTELQTPMLNAAMARTAAAEQNFLWPNGKVLYSFAAEVSPSRQLAVRAAMDHLESLTCVTFQKVGTNVNARVVIRALSTGTGCSAVVGYRGSEQYINLNEDFCYHPNTICHEIMHSLGFYHEQSHNDRDNYIRINTNNIIEGKEFAFRKIVESSNHGLPFDYDSVMLYGPNAFSKNGLPTIETLCPNVILTAPRQKSDISDGDINKINIMYKCPGWENIVIGAGGCP